MTDAWHCVQLHSNLCTPEWDLPGMGSGCNSEWYSISNPVNFQNLAMLGGYQLIHVWYQKKNLQSPLTNYVFGVAMGGLLLKLQNFKKVKLIFGHPVLITVTVRGPTVLNFTPL